MKTRKWMIVLALSLTGVFTACDDDDDDVTPTTLEQSDIDYLNRITQGNLAEIAWSSVAQDSATNARVLQFAQQMVTEHRQAQNQVDSLADAYNVNLSSSLDTSYARLRDSLRARGKGRNFDTLFMGNQVRLHDVMIGHLSGASTNAKNNDIRTLSSRHLLNVTKHRDSANSIKSSL